jgi:hypothetical protein
MAGVTILSEILAADLGYGFENEELRGGFDKALDILHIGKAKLDIIKRCAKEALTKLAL